MARVEESLSILSNSIEKSGLADQIGAGIVLTGGMTKLKGIRELAQAIFRNSPIRIGLPREIGGMTEDLKDPAFSTVVGLLMYQSGKHTQYEINNDKEMLHSKIDAQDIELRNIKLNEEKKSTMVEHKRVETQSHSSATRRAARNSEHESTNDSFSFDDLPKPEQSDGNIITKTSNWLKQLF
jgi:cell division protein FtsA